MLEKIVKGLQFADLHVNRVLTVAVGVLVFFCMILITFSITGRYLFGTPVPSTDEISETILVLVIFLPLAYIERQGGHLRIMFLYSRFSERWQNVCDILAKVLVLLLLSLMTWQTLLYALHSWACNEISWGTVSIPLWIPKFSIFFGCLLFSLHVLGSLGIKVKNLVRRVS
jgi:TRAP-type C4-dicarboxylate transport system permease small subunit